MNQPLHKTNNVVLDSSYRPEFHLHQFEMIIDFNSQILYIRKWVRDFVMRAFTLDVHQGVNLKDLKNTDISGFFDRIESLRKNIINFNSDLSYNHYCKIDKYHFEIEIKVNCLQVFSDSKYIGIQVVKWKREKLSKLNNNNISYRNLFYNLINRDENVTYLMLDKFYNVVEFNSHASSFYKNFFDIPLSVGVNFGNQLEYNSSANGPVLLRHLSSKSRKDFIIGKGNTVANIRYKFTIDPIRPRNSAPIILIRGEDVTKHIRQREKTRYFKAIIRSLESELDTFIYSLSHGLMSPIATLQGLINLIESNGTVSGNTLEYFDHIKSSSSRMEQLVTRMKEYYLNRRKHIEPEGLNMPDLIKEIVNDYAEELTKKEIEVKYDFKIKEDFIQDFDRIRILIDNLFNNSVRFVDSKKSGVIHIQVTIDEGQMSFELVDNGLGIDEIHIDKVFDLFYKANIEKSNTGVGLFLANQIVMTLKGTIKVESRLGDWTKVIICLPSLKV